MNNNEIQWKLEQIITQQKTRLIKNDTSWVYIGWRDFLKKFKNFEIWTLALLVDQH